jgi:3-carboxy-cis,cis-muconate cycloisomerase
VAEALSDRNFVAAMLRFEAALARAQADAGLIAASAAQSIAGTCKVELFDVPKLVRESTRTRCLSTPLLGSLRETVALFNADAATVVNHGCNLADVVDSAMALISRDALDLIEADLAATLRQLLHLAALHAADPMLARTPLQAASVTSFGLRCIQWAAPLMRSQQRLQTASRHALRLQIGSELANFAQMKDQGAKVTAQMAAELQLAAPRTGLCQRDEWSVMVSEIGLLTASLGEVAADIWHLLQPELAELAQTTPEPLSGNCTACMVTLAAAQRTPLRVAALLASLTHAHAPGLGRWQASLAEWPALLMSAHGAARAVAELLAKLQVNTNTMRNNLLAWRASLPAREAAERLSLEDVALAAQLTQAQLNVLQTELAAMPIHAPNSGTNNPASTGEHHQAIA